MSSKYIRRGHKSTACREFDVYRWVKCRFDFAVELLSCTGQNSLFLGGVIFCSNCGDLNLTFCPPAGGKQTNGRPLPSAPRFDAYEPINSSAMFISPSLRLRPPPLDAVRTRHIGVRVCARQLSQEIIALHQVARFVSTYYFVYLLTTMAGLYRWIFQVRNVRNQNAAMATAAPASRNNAPAGSFTHRGYTWKAPPR